MNFESPIKDTTYRAVSRLLQAVARTTDQHTHVEVNTKHIGVNNGPIFALLDEAEIVCAPETP